MISKEKMIELYTEKNLTQAEIGEIYGCDRKNVDYYLKKYGIPKRTRLESQSRLRKTDLTADDILKMVEGGMLLKDICDKYQVTRNTLYRITKRAGINLRNHELKTELQSEMMKVDNPFNDEKTKEIAIKRSLKARVQNYKEKYSVFVDMDFKLYSRKARSIAYQHYGRGTKSKDGYTIDHKFSVKDGYENKVPLSVLSHPFNLRLIPVKENRTKSDKSIISIDELYEGVGVQRLSIKE